MDEAESKYIPETMNIELTTNCPLHCPQCYCSLTGGENIDLETAVYWIKEGAKLGVKEVMLSGGETLCYPHIYEVVRAARTYCGHANVALSGFGFTQQVYERLVEAGVTGIYISLNGSTQEINAQSRDGFSMAISALKLLQKNSYPNTTINWVMHSTNADDFLNVVNLAQKYDVANIVIIGLKPDSKKSLSTLPTKEQMYSIKDIVRSHKGKTRIFIESCYSPLLALTCDTKLFGNMNVGKNKGCGAGRTTFSVSVDGFLTPCRHLEYREKFETVSEYWENSDVLRKLREMDSDHPVEPCASCRLLEYCRPCAAIAGVLEDVGGGKVHCSLADSREP